MKLPYKFAVLSSAILTLCALNLSAAAPGDTSGGPPGGPGMGGPGGPGGPGGAPGGGRRAGGGGGRGSTPDHPHTLTPYFVPATAKAKAPDKDGFIQRWLLLEPINKPNRGNTVFTDTYVRDAFINQQYFPDQLSVLPNDGDKVTVTGQELTWHALDSTGFNVKLFRFADGVNKQTYGVIFWAVTVVNAPREMKNVRLAAGSNSASVWWVNGQEAVDLFGDRRMVMDDGVSKRLTLKQGRNIVRGAVINGPGMSDFCARFIDDQGNPVKDLTITLDNGK